MQFTSSSSMPAYHIAVLKTVKLQSYFVVKVQSTGEKCFGHLKNFNGSILKAQSTYVQQPNESHFLP